MKWHHSISRVTLKPHRDEENFEPAKLIRNRGKNETTNDISQEKHRSRKFRPKFASADQIPQWHVGNIKRLP